MIYIPKHIKIRNIGEFKSLVERLRKFQLEVGRLKPKTEKERHRETVIVRTLERKICDQMGIDISELQYADSVPPFDRLCSKCDHVNDKLTLYDREWTCPECGSEKLCNLDEAAKDAELETAEYRAPRKDLISIFDEDIDGIETVQVPGRRASDLVDPGDTLEMRLPFDPARRIEELEAEIAVLQRTCEGCARRGTQGKGEN